MNTAEPRPPAGVAKPRPTGGRYSGVASSEWPIDRHQWLQIVNGSWMEPIDGKAALIANAEVVLAGH
jgi:hypothetical protein